uniref:uncharacterized protein LOC101309899 n=1 Tax=Fragaria vesca subsp. vesca TaxID=101020 RepID=UPI0005C8DF7C|nr:PREDICTED: uncharacterized protein LOC101309899 [Fragaria vesca subsp. vesca]
MQSMLNLHGTFGLPLCVSGITHHHPPHLTHEMADHDRRREAMKKQRSRAREELNANREMGAERIRERVTEEIIDGDLAALLRDLSLCYLANCIAKAA